MSTQDVENLIENKLEKQNIVKNQVDFNKSIKKILYKTTIKFFTSFQQPVENSKGLTICIRAFVKGIQAVF